MPVKPDPVRDEVLYVKVQKKNKAWVEKEAKRLNLSASRFMDAHITEQRTKKKK